MKELLLGLIFVTFPLAFTYSSHADDIPLCRDFDFSYSKPEVGFKCKKLSYRDLVFERVNDSSFGSAWKSSEGVVWSDIVSFSTHPEALKVCMDLGGHLPRKKDFIPTLPDFYDDFWAHETTHSSEFAYIFTYSSTCGHCPRANRNRKITLAVRCIKKLGGPTLR